MISFIPFGDIFHIHIYTLKLKLKFVPFFGRSEIYSPAFAMQFLCNRLTLCALLLLCKCSRISKCMWGVCVCVLCFFFLLRCCYSLLYEIIEQTKGVALETLTF